MTVVAATTAPNRPQHDVTLRALPWRRMAWVTWRQHRVALFGAAAFLGALALYVWIVGLQLHHAYAAAFACHPANSATCSDLLSGLTDKNHVFVGGYVLQIVPPLIGAFVGAPVLARELEAGTFRYAWTQGFGRWRWALAKLVILAVAVTALAGAFSALLSWYYEPYLATRNATVNLTELSPFSLGLFDLRGIAFAAWTLVAFAIGVLAGMLLRRVVPAIVATLAAYTGLALVAANLLRRHYMTPVLTRAVNVPGSAWIYREWWTKAGAFAFTSWRDAPHALIVRCATVPTGPRGKPPQAELAQCFAAQGYTHWTSYQPVGRFWTFQGIESAWLAVLSAVLVAAAVWVVRHRAA